MSRADLRLRKIRQITTLFRNIVSNSQLTRPPPNLKTPNQPISSQLEIAKSHIRTQCTHLCAGKKTPTAEVPKRSYFSTLSRSAQISFARVALCPPSASPLSLRSRIMAPCRALYLYVYATAIFALLLDCF